MTFNTCEKVTKLLRNYEQMFAVRLENKNIFSIM